MNFLRLYFLSLLLVTLSACEGLDKRLYERTPHIPVFAGIEKGAESKSNPYWSRFAAVNDSIEVKTTTNGTHIPDRPSMYGSLGTYYRSPENYYFYMMTGGYGAQYDIFLSDSMKISPSIWLGFSGRKGASLSLSKKVGEYRDGDVIVYAAFQRQEIKVDLFCIDSKDSCSSGGLKGDAKVQASQDIMNSILGVQLGRFQIGKKGYTTVLFKLEVGMHEVLNNKITSDPYTSGFSPDTASPLVSAYADFTLW